MRNKFFSIIICLLLVFSLVPAEKTYGDSYRTAFKNYLDNMDLSYKDLDLTEEELAAITELQNNGGITYGMSVGDEAVYMVFEQISKVFEIDTECRVYEDFPLLLDHVASGKVDFTGSLIPTDERLEIYDFTSSTHKDKLFLFVKSSDFSGFDFYNKESEEKLVVAYPEGYAVNDLISDSFSQSMISELIPINNVDEVIELLEQGKIDAVFGGISWYSDLIMQPNFMALDFTDYIDVYFAGNVTKKGTNTDFISAINKLYSNTDAIIELQHQIDNYYEFAALDKLHEKYYDVIDHENVNKIYTTEYRPYVYLEDGKPTGLMVDLLDRIFNSFDMPYSITFVDDLEEIDLEDSGVDVAMPVFMNNETMKQYHMSIPISKTRLTIICKTSSVSSHFTTPSDFGIQKIGALNYDFTRDYVDEVFLNNQDVVYYNDLDSLTSAIEAGEITFGIVPYISFNKYAIEEQLVDISTIDNVELPRFYISYAMPLTERGEQFEAIFSSALSIFNYSDLETKYLSTKPEVEVIYEYQKITLNSILHYTVFTSIFTIIILITAIYLNRKRGNTDYLTKLRNRRTLEAYIKATKSKKNMSIAYIDLDNFKTINDVYGHHYGDRVLIYVAEALKKLSEHSRAFRIGGDEFIIVYNNKSINFEEDIKKVLGVTISIEQTDIKVEGSIGNLDLENHSELIVEDIINLVDYAMISAKRRGKNLIVEIDDDLVENYKIIRDLRLALEKEQYANNLKFYFETIKAKETLQGFCLIAKCHYNGKFIDYKEIQIHMTNKLVLNKIGLVIFDKLCMSISQLNTPTEAKMRFIHDLSTESITEQNIKSLANILEKHNINPKDITLRVDPTLFVGSKGKTYVSLLNSLGCDTSVDFYKMTGESLLCLNEINLSLIELDLTGIVTFLKSYNEAEILEITEKLSTNLALNKLIDLAEVFKTDLLLYTSCDKYEYFIMEYIISNLKTRVFIIEKNNLTSFEDYLNNINKFL